MSKQTTITMTYKGRKASLRLIWDKSPFEDCNAEFEGDPSVLGAYHHQRKGRLGYFIHKSTLSNIETHLNAVYSASTFFEGFKYSMTPSVDLEAFLKEENKEEDRVY